MEEDSLGGFGDTTDESTAYPEAYTNALRGLLLGLLLGDVRNPGAEILRSGPPSQMTILTTDALVRHELCVRERRVRTDPLFQVRQSLLRWATMQRQLDRHDLLNGWICQVPAMYQARGAAPATMRAIPALNEGQHLADNDSKGAHAVLRSLPIAAASAMTNPDAMASWCQASAGLTHGHPEAWAAASFMGVLVGAHLTMTFKSGLVHELDPTVALGWLQQGAPHDPLLRRLEMVLTDDTPYSRERLAALAGDESAGAVVAGALYLHLHFPDHSPAALRKLAAAAQHSHAVAALAGALVGLEHGVDCLDIDELCRHELTWVTDTVARDLCTVMWALPWQTDEGHDVLGDMSDRYPPCNRFPPQTCPPEGCERPPV